MESSATGVITHSDNLSPSNDLLKVLLSKKTDPRYVDSFGDEAFRRPLPFGLNTVAWRVKGLVCSKWNKLKQPLMSLINEKRPEWESERPSAQADSDGAHIPLHSLDCFLVGTDKLHATPHVAIISNSQWLREALKGTIRKSGILKSDGFKCCGLAMAVRTPASPTACLFDDDGDKDGPPPPALGLADTDGFVGFEGSEAWATIPLTNGLSLNGILLEVRHNGQRTGEATIGGLIAINGVWFGLTVRHAFSAPSLRQAPVRPGISLPLPIDDDQLDVFELAERAIQPPRLVVSAYQDDVKTFMTIPPSSYLRQTRNPYGDWVTINPMQPLEFDTWEHHSNPLRHFNLFCEGKEILAASSGRLDYALVPLPQHVSPADQEVDKAEDTGGKESVRILTGNGISRTGVIISSGILGIGPTQFPQEVIVVRLNPLDNNFRDGDCGSWAKTTVDGRFFGMLIGWCPELGDAYLLPLQDIIDDIAKHLKPHVRSIIIPQGGPAPSMLAASLPSTDAPTSGTNAAAFQANAAAFNANEAAFRVNSGSHGFAFGSPAGIVATGSSPVPDFFLAPEPQGPQGYPGSLRLGFDRSRSRERAPPASRLRSPHGEVPGNRESRDE